MSYFSIAFMHNAAFSLFYLILLHIKTLKFVILLNILYSENSEKSLVKCKDTRGENNNKRKHYLCKLLHLHAP